MKLWTTPSYYHTGQRTLCNRNTPNAQFSGYRCDSTYCVNEAAIELPDGWQYCENHIDRAIFCGQKESENRLRRDFRRLELLINVKAAEALEPYRRAFAALRDAREIADTTYEAYLPPMLPIKKNGRTVMTPYHKTDYFESDTSHLVFWFDGKGVTYSDPMERRECTFTEDTCIPLVKCGEVISSIDGEAHTDSNFVEIVSQCNALPIRFADKMVEAGILDKIKAISIYLGEDDGNS